MKENEIVHVPVLLDEVLGSLDPKPDEDYVDGTVGQGGHSEAILKRTAPKGRILAIDRDARNLSAAKGRLAGFGNRVAFVRGSFADVAQAARENGFVGPVSGGLLDLGFSSAHISDASRGFSFAPGPLDMRYDVTQDLTAAKLVNEGEEEELARVLRVLGEEPNARKIAKAIIDARRAAPIATTDQLADIVSAVVPRRGKIHPATKTFQALRIAVNDELGEVERALPAFIGLLKPGGRLAVISFHSLEDRLVKRFFKQEESTSIRLITKKPIVPSEEEVRRNPRARSAKLRVVEKI
jgi:16S rRNA (cytosine1402-N4)-methyltransferase